MTKWWLLLSALALWLVLGYALPRPPEVDAQPGPGDLPAPDRIVSLAPNLTEILFALGLGEEVVGVTQDSDYPPAAMDKPKVGSFWQPSIEYLDFFVRSTLLIGGVSVVLVSWCALHFQRKMDRRQAMTRSDEPDPQTVFCHDR